MDSAVLHTKDVVSMCDACCMRVSRLDQVNRMQEVQALRRLGIHPNILQLKEVLLWVFRHPTYNDFYLTFFTVHLLLYVYADMVFTSNLWGLVYFRKYLQLIAFVT